MGWFERQLEGRAPEDVEKEHGRYLRAAGVDRAIDALNGPYGVRRYIIRFGENEGRVRVSDIEAVPLSCGGGPPPFGELDPPHASVEGRQDQRT